MKFEPNEILAMGKFNPVKTKLSKFRPSSPITPNIILIFFFFFWQFLAMEEAVGSYEISINNYKIKKS